MKISMFPGNMVRNDYVALLRASLTRAGAEVVSYDWARGGLLGGGLSILHVQMVEALFTLRPYRYRDDLALAWLRVLTRRAERLRAQGGHVVWTAHNIAPHDGLAHRFPKAWRHWCEETTPLVDRVVALSEDSIADIRAAWPSLRQARYDTIPHPHYRDVYRHRRLRIEERRRLGLPENGLVFGAIGAVRPYKGLVELVGAARRVLSPDQRLLIAGICYDEALDRDIRRAIDGDGRIVYRPRWLDDEDYASVLGCVDLAVLNYREILNSGSLFAALSLEVPVIAPALGSIICVAREVGAPWVRVFDGPVDEALRAAIVAERPPPGATLDLSAYDPVRIGALHLQTYR